MKNKGFIFGALGVAVAALLIAPKLLGGQIEAQVRDLPNQKMVQDLGAVYGFELALTEYQSGWFTSEATFEITLPEIYQRIFVQKDGENFEPLPPLVYTVPIKHGPVLIGDGGISIGAALMETDTHSMGENLEAYSNALKSFPNLHSATRFDFSGNQNTKTTFPKGSLEREMENGILVTISWEETVFKGELDNENQMFWVDFLMPGFTMNIPEQSSGAMMLFTMEDMEGEFTYDLTNTAPVFTAEGWFEMGPIAMEMVNENGEEFAFSLAGLREEINLIRHDNPDIVGYNVPLEVGAIDVTRDGETTTYLQSLNMTIVVDNLDQNKIMAFYDNYFDAVMNFSAQPGDQATDQAAEKLLRAYLTLLETGLQFNVPSAHAITLKGTVDYDHTLQLPPIENPETVNMEAWVLGIDYNGNARFSPEFTAFMIDQTLKNQLGENFETLNAETLETLRNNTIMQMTLAGYLVANEDGTYSTNLAFRGGVLTINGNPMDMTPFLGGAG